MDEVISILLFLTFFYKKRISRIGDVGKFVGNDGYIKTSMSKNAAFAKERGIYPLTQFRQVYKISKEFFSILLNIGYIVYSEWHHTSPFLNRTNFYKWVDSDVMIIVLRNKKMIKKLTTDKFIELVERELVIDREGLNDPEYRKYLYQFIPDIPDVYTFSDGIQINTISKEIFDPKNIEVNKSLRKHRRQLFRKIRQSMYDQKLIQSKSYEDFKNNK